METVKEQKARVYKSYHGWIGETITTANGQTFKITTMKRHSGQIVSNAQPGEAGQDGNFQTFTVTDMFQGSIELIKQTRRATEKAIRQQHAKAVILFDEKVQAGEIQAEKPEKPEVGSILFLDGYGKTKGSPENRHVVYKIEPCKWYGEKYLTVELDTLKLDSKSARIKPFSKKFGIGTYFEPVYTFDGSENDLNNLVIEAKEKAADDRKKEEAEKEMAEQVRRAKIEEGRELVNIPSWAEAVIVADHYENKSDPMTDYFATTVTDTVYLAFSGSTRNNMPELKKAAKAWDVTRELLNDEDTGEHREQHSYLPNYFVGSSRWYGWKINKKKYFDLSSEENREKLYIAAAEDRYKIEEAKETETAEEIETPEDVHLEQYSEKAGVVRGDTKPIKEQLKDLGCRFNPRLKNGPGWIYPIKRHDEIAAALNI